MPEVLVAGSDGLDASGAIVHSKVESDSAVAADGIGLDEGGRIGAVFIGYAVPCVAVAGGDILDTSSTIVDGEMKRDGAVTTDGVGLVEGGCVGGSSVGCAVPSVMVAGGDGLDAGGAVVHSQIECVDIGAARAGLAMVEGVNARRGILLVMPSVTITTDDMIGGIVMLVDGQMERVGTGTAVGVGVGIDINARGCVRGAMPGVEVTRLLSEAVMCAMIDGQHELHGAVAAFGCLPNIHGG